MNVIYGTDRADVIYATPAPDVIYAKSGSDSIRNVDDGDVVWASSGNDVVTIDDPTGATGITIELNVGNDRITGEAWNSYVNGDSGNDVITLAGCENEIVGGSGRDRYTNPSNNRCGSQISMGDGDDTVTATFANEVLLGNGKDILNTSFPGTVHTGSGNDFVDFADFPGFGSGDADVSLGSGDDKLNLENTHFATVHGSSGKDRVYGLGYHNVIDTQSGDDRIELFGVSSHNALDGGPGHGDRALLSRTSTATTCTRIERVTDLGSNPYHCG